MVHPDGEPPSRAYISATGFLCVLCVSVVQFQLPNLVFWAVSSMTYSGMGETPMPRAGKRVPRGIGFPADVSRVGRP